MFSNVDEAMIIILAIASSALWPFNVLIDEVKKKKSKARIGLQGSLGREKLFVDETFSATPLSGGTYYRC